MSLCFCTGECREKGYCPHTTNMFGNYCEECGKPLPYSYPHICSLCHTKSDSEQEDLNLDNFDLTESVNCTPKVEAGDEIWFKRGNESHVFHKFVDTVKGNVIRTVGEKDHVGDADASWTNDKWWEIDNLKILEVEKDV